VDQIGEEAANIWLVTSAFRAMEVIKWEKLLFFWMELLSLSFQQPARDAA
jgi:hypothetical protein